MSGQVLIITDKKNDFVTFESVLPTIAFVISMITRGSDYKMLQRGQRRITFKHENSPAHNHWHKLACPCSYQVCDISAEALSPLK